MKKINTILFGLGNIGMMYDYKNKDKKIFLTHAKSIFFNKNYNLVAAIDSNFDKISLFKKKFNLKAYKSISDINICNKIHLVVIATPANTHFNIIKKVLIHLKPKVILCEKPFTDNFYKANTLIKLCEKFKTKLFINYIRNSLTVFHKIKKLIKHQKFFFKCEVNFSGNILNNGCHYFILFNELFDNYISYKIIKHNQNNIKIVINYKNCTLLIQNMEKKDQYRSDKISIVNSNFSISWDNKSDTVNFNNYNIKTKSPSGIKQYQKYVYKEIVKYFFYKKKNLQLVNPFLAIKFLKFYDEVKRNYNYESKSI